MLSFNYCHYRHIEFALKNSVGAPTVTRNGSKLLMQKHRVNFKNVSTSEQIRLYGSLFLLLGISHLSAD